MGQLIYMSIPVSTRNIHTYLNLYLYLFINLYLFIPRQHRLSISICMHMYTYIYIYIWLFCPGFLPSENLDIPLVELMLQCHRFIYICLRVELYSLRPCYHALRPSRSLPAAMVCASLYAVQPWATHPCVCVCGCVCMCVCTSTVHSPPHQMMRWTSSNDEVDLIKWWGGSQRASNDEPHPLVSHAPLKLVCVVSPISFGSLVSLIHIYIYCVSFFLLLCLVWQFLIVFIAFSNFLFYCRIVVLCTFVKVKNWLYLLSLIFPDLRRWISSLFWIIYIWLRLYISTIIGRTLW